MGKGFLSYAATVILQSVSSGYLYGFDIIDITGLPGGRSTPRSAGSKKPGTSIRNGKTRKSRSRNLVRHGSITSSLEPDAKY